MQWEVVVAVKVEKSVEVAVEVAEVAVAVAAAVAVAVEEVLAPGLVDRAAVLVAVAVLQEGKNRAKPLGNGNREGRRQEKGGIEESGMHRWLCSRELRCNVLGGTTAVSKMPTTFAS